MAEKANQNITKVHTFADDVAAVQGANVSDESISTDTAATEAADSTSVPTAPTSATPPAAKPAEPKRTYEPQSTTPVHTASEFLKTSEHQAASKPAPTTPKPPVTSEPKLQSEPVPPSTPTPQKTSTPDAIHKTQIPRKVADSIADEIAQVTPSRQVAADTDLDTDLETGTIISDKKQKRFHFFSALGSSVVDTVQSLVRAVIPTPKKGVSVSSSESRRDVITSAAKRSYNIPSDDFATIQKKKASEAPQTEEKEGDTALQIKAAPTAKDSNWSHYTENKAAKDSVPANLPTANQPEEPEGTVPKIPTTPKTTTVPDAPTVRVVEDFSDSANKPPASHTLDIRQTPTPPKREVVAEAPVSPVKSVAASVSPTPKKPEPPKPIPTPTPTPLPTQKPTPAPAAILPDEESAFPDSFRDPTPPKRSQWLQTISRYAIVFVIVGAVGLGVSTAFVWFGTSTTDPTNRIVSVPSLITTNQQIAIQLPDTRATLLSNLKQETDRATQMAQFYPVYDITSDPLVPANPADILTALAFRTPGNLQRSVTSITLGATAGSKPFLILRVQDFDIAFAGMLTWEAAMSADLEPWFGPVVTQTFDSTARTDNQLRAAFFADYVENNTNVRVLVDENRTTRITYGFVNPQTILITTDTTTFQTLRNQILNR